MQKIYIRMQKYTCAKLHTCVKANLLRVYMDVLKGVYFNSVLYLVFFFIILSSKIVNPCIILMETE